MKRKPGSHPMGRQDFPFSLSPWWMQLCHFSEKNVNRENRSPILVTPARSLISWDCPVLSHWNSIGLCTKSQDILEFSRVQAHGHSQLHVAVSNASGYPSEKSPLTSTELPRVLCASGNISFSQSLGGRTDCSPNLQLIRTGAQRGEGTCPRTHKGVLPPLGAWLISNHLLSFLSSSPPQCAG